MSKLTDEHIAEIFSVRRGAVIESHLLGCARAIEYAATEPLLQRIAELEENERAFKQVILQMQDSIDFLQRQLEDVRKDADRYRWLKEHRVDSVEPEGIAGTTYKDLYFRWYSPIWDKGVRQQPVDIDEAIDAAMQKGQS